LFFDLIYQKFIRPALFKFDAEWSHHLTLSSLSAIGRVGGGKLLESWFGYEHPALRVRAFNLNFSNPIGLAAGFDKDAKCLEALAALGFGFIEAGTVTFHPQKGNPRPRLRRLPELEALWNHLGFNNDGAQFVSDRLKSSKVPIPIGINLGKSKIAPLENAVKDYLSSFKLLHMLSDYVVLNVSSPNTPGVRTLAERDKLSELLRVIEEFNQAKKPILIKVSPDLSREALDAVIEVGLKYRVDGFIATNTTLSREGMPPRFSG